MYECQGGSPNNDGVVPIMFEGLSMLFAWIKSCDIWSVGAKLKLREFIGPLAVLVFYTKSGAGEIEKDVCLKVIGKRWTISVLLYHWPMGSAVPKMLVLQVDELEGEAMSGAGGRLMWNDDGCQTVKRFAVTRTSRRDLILWTHSMRLNESCGSLRFYGPEEAGSGEIAKWERDAVESEGDLRAAQAERGKGSALVHECDSSLVGNIGSEDGGRKTEGGKKITVVKDSVALEYDGHFYELRGKKRWEAVWKLIEADGEYVEFKRGFKSLFANCDAATAFFEAAIEAEGLGRNGTRRYRLRK